MLQDKYSNNLLAFLAFAAGRNTERIEMKLCEQIRRKGNFYAAEAGQVYPLSLPLPDPPKGKMSVKKEIVNADI